MSECALFFQTLHNEKKTQNVDWIWNIFNCVDDQDSPDLMLLLRMLSLGQGAWDMIDSQVFKEPRLVCV